MRTSSYVIYVPIPQADFYYILHGYSGAVDKVSPEVVQYLLDRADPLHTWHIQDEDLARVSLRGRYSDPSEATIQMLTDRGYLTTKTLEQERIYVQQLSALLHKRTLARAKPGFLIIPTYECNLRCTYCYEANLRTELSHQRCLKATMSRELVDALFECMTFLVSKCADQAAPGAEPKKGVNVTLYGGEPLWTYTLPIVEYIVQKSRDQNMTFSAITNAVELDRFVHLLGPECIRWLQVTLDGPRDIHNQRRLGPQYPAGTYDQILNNIMLALEHDVKVSVRLHVDARSVHRVDEVMSDLSSRGLLGAKKFSIYVQTTHSWHRGHPVPAYPDVSMQGVQKSLEAGPFRMYQEKGLSLSDNNVAEKLDKYIRRGLIGLCPGMEPCSATTGMHIFDPFGKIHACWDTAGLCNQEIGSYETGRPVYNEREKAWRSRSPAQIPECSDCKYVLFHYGGCPDIPVATGRGLTGPGCYEFEGEFTWVSRKFFSSDMLTATLKKQKEESEKRRKGEDESQAQAAVTAA